MKGILSVAIFVLLATGCRPQAGVPSVRLQQPNHPVSYVTPEGWMQTRLAGMYYIIVSAPAEYGVEPNIYVEQADPQADIAGAARNLKKHYTSGFPAYRVIDQEEFIADAGGEGIKIIALRESADGLPFSTFHYIVRQNHKTAVITCTCAEQVRAKFEPVFDSAMKTIQIDE